MSLKSSDLAKLAVGIAAGYFTQSYITSILEDNDDGAIEKALKMCTSIAGGGIAGGIATSFMDSTGASDLIDDISGEIGDFFDF